MQKLDQACIRTFAGLSNIFLSSHVEQVQFVSHTYYWQLSSMICALGNLAGLKLSGQEKKIVLFCFKNILNGNFQILRPDAGYFIYTI